MTQFVPSVWKAEGEHIQTAADTFYRSAYDVIVMGKYAQSSNSPIEVAIKAPTDACQDKWHRLIAGAFEGLTGVSSRMVGTGADYEATEEAAASERFWQ